MATVKIPTRVRENLLALGYPEDIDGLSCHITARYRHDRAQTFTNVRIIACYLGTKGKFQELIIKIKPQIHMGGIFDTLRRNVGPNTSKTSWWTDVHYPKEGESRKGIRSESWRILGLTF